VGGCTLEAAEAVCPVGGGLGIDVLDGLGSLVDKSLLRQGEQEREPRFGMLETIREFALEQVQASGELGDLRRRHAAYFLGLAAEAESKLRTAEQDSWLARLESEHDNLRAVLAWSQTEAGEAQTACGWPERSGGSGTSTATTPRAVAGSTRCWPPAAGRRGRSARRRSPPPANWCNARPSTAGRPR